MSNTLTITMLNQCTLNMLNMYDGIQQKRIILRDTEMTKFSCKTFQSAPDAVHHQGVFYLTVDNDSLAVLYHGSTIRSLNRHRNFPLLREPCDQTVLQGQLRLSRGKTSHTYLNKCKGITLTATPEPLSISISN